jgi:hypothetical protein
MSDARWERSRVHLSLTQDVFFVDAPDGSGWLLDFNGSFFALNPTAVRLLRAALKGDEREIFRIAATGGTTPERVHMDLTNLISQLVGSGLLATKPQTDLYPLPRWAALLLKTTVGTLPTLRHLARLLLLSWLMFRRLGWQRTVTSLRAYVRPASNTTAQLCDSELASAVRDAVASCPIWVGCKERAIATAVVAWAAGRSAKVVLGVSPFPLTSHAWCEVDGHVVTDPLDRVEAFIRVADYT